MVSSVTFKKKLNMPINRFFKSLFLSREKRRHSLLYLNIAQFLGVINDNIFKLVVAFLLIDSLGSSQASLILSATGAIYVIPFLLFSSSAGILADRFSKQKLLVLMKCAEIIVMIMAIFAFGAKSISGCFILLFFLSIHSALFGPSKYGIIPELVPAESVSKANGLVTSFTYLAIILGTFFASFLTEITNRHFVIIAFFCLSLAFLGFLATFGIKKTPPQGSSKKMNLLFIREIYYTMRYCRTVPHLIPAILGSAFFLFIGGFTQLNIIPFALQSLNLSEISGGYLFLATALGIALGAFLAGKASRKRVELGLPCLAGFGIALFFALLKLFSTSLIAVIICLLFIGVLGGAFIVPFDTFIQLTSDKIKRGQTIGATNFLSFLGVLMASFLLYLFNQVFELSPSTSFLVLSAITFLVSFTLSLRLIEFALHYFSRKILKPLCHYQHPRMEELDRTKEAILIIEKFTWKKALLLLSSVPQVHYFLSEKSKKWCWIFHLLPNIHPLTAEQNLEDMITLSLPLIERGKIPCLLLDQALSFKENIPSKGLFSLFKKSIPSIFFTHFSKDLDNRTITAIFTEKK